MSDTMNNSENIKLTVIIPVYNEGINLKMMLRMLRVSIEMSHELLIVYDIDNDDSLPVVEAMQGKYPHLKAIQNTYGRGVPNALRYGYEHAKGKYILVLTADDMGPILSVDKMYDLMEEGYDLVNCTRYSKGGRYLGGVFISRVLSRLANKLFCIFTKSQLTDLTLGIKMFRKSILKQIPLKAQTGWAIAFELALKVQIARLKMVEVPIISINRFYGGESNFKLGSWVVEYSKWFVWGLKEFSKMGLLRFQRSPKIEFYDELKDSKSDEKKNSKEMV